MPRKSLYCLDYLKDYFNRVELVLSQYSPCPYMQMLYACDALVHLCRSANLAVPQEAEDKLMDGIIEINQEVFPYLIDLINENKEEKFLTRVAILLEAKKKAETYRRMFIPNYDFAQNVDLLLRRFFRDLMNEPEGQGDQFRLQWHLLRLQNNLLVHVPDINNSVTTVERLA